MKIFFFFILIITFLSGCNSGAFIGQLDVKHTDIQVFLEKVPDVSGELLVEIVSTTEKQFVSNQDRNIFLSLSTELRGSGIETKEDEYNKGSHKLKIEYAIVKDTIYSRELSAIKINAKLFDASNLQIANIRFINLSKLKKSGEVVESIDGLASRAGKLIASILIKMQGEQTPIKGEWVNAYGQTTLAIKHESNSNHLVGLEGEILSKGNTNDNLGEVQWLQIEDYKKCKGSVCRYSGLAKDINKANDTSWETAEFVLVGDVMLIQHSFWAGEETSVYFKKQKKL